MLFGFQASDQLVSVDSAFGFGPSAPAVFPEANRVALGPEQHITHRAYFHSDTCIKQIAEWLDQSAPVSSAPC